MADVHIPDHVLHNILARLPAKPLLRFRCVSMQWSRLISDPYFINSRSRRMILLGIPPSRLSNRYFMKFTSHGMITPMNDTMVKLPPPFGNTRGREITIIGSFNGIVLLVHKNGKLVTNMILYNPFTHASKKVPNPPTAPRSDYQDVYGFGYGTGTPDDLKIVKFRTLRHADSDPLDVYGLDVFSLNQGSWSRLQIWSLHEVVQFRDKVGTFLNGFLHWLAYLRTKMVIVALNVKEMVVSEIPVPHQPKNQEIVNLGTLHGCLCMMEKYYFPARLEVWVMKEQGSWSKACSFNLLSPEGNPLKDILGDGRIVMADHDYPQIIIYDTSKGLYTYKGLNVSSKECYFNRIKGIEYVESMVSP